ncbi:MAG: hypothetical protein WC975_12835 [Phycisphaerae bacterium]
MTVKKRIQLLIDEVSETGHCVVFRGRGRKRVALIPVPDDEFLERIEEQIDLRLAKKRKKERGGVTIEELCRKYGVRTA